MGRRRDHRKLDVAERTFTDPHTRNEIKIVTISASAHIEKQRLKEGTKLGSTWESQTVARQRGKRPAKFRKGYRTSW